MFGLHLHFDRVGQLRVGSCAGGASRRAEGRCRSAGDLTQTSTSPWAPCLSSPSYAVLSSPGVREVLGSAAGAMSGLCDLQWCQPWREGWELLLEKPFEMHR